jgi:hypothetical protein
VEERVRADVALVSCSFAPMDDGLAERLASFILRGIGGVPEVGTEGERTECSKT